MGGGGSIQGMSNSLKINRQMLRKKTYFRKERSFLNRKREFHKAAGIIDLKTATTEELAEIRHKIIKRRRQNNLKFLLFFMVIFIPILYFSIGFFKNETEKAAMIEVLEKDRKMEKYRFYIEDGDSYIKKGQWHNAMFQYNKAIELFPNDYHATYRYAYAAVYRCRNVKEKCNVASTALEKLLKDFPNQQELVELEQILLFAVE